jgi:hypothetical protein
MTTPVYDVIIIGGGMAGLYAAYRLLKKHKRQISILLLEKEPHLGGRAGTEIFHTVPISIGAGVGRKDKDLLLVDLLRELKIPNHEFQTSTNYPAALQAPAKLLSAQFTYLRSKYRDPAIKRQYEGKTFGEYAKKMLGQEAYKAFSQCAGYTDYEDTDIRYVLHDYGFDDNTTSWTGISLHWSDMIEGLAKNIGSSNIRKNHPVSAIREIDGPHRLEVVSKSRVFRCNSVILATTVDVVRRLLPMHSDLYSKIHGQHFLRMYGKFTKESSRIMTQYVQTQTVVQGPIHKIIPIDQEKGVHMVVYSDNDDALLLNKYRKNTKKNRDIICRYLEAALAISENTLIMTDLCDFYWDIGTHFYEPMNLSVKINDFIKRAQHPSPNIFVVGEMISRNQGWVEGALESVDSILS